MKKLFKVDYQFLFAVYLILCHNLYFDFYRQALVAEVSLRKAKEAAIVSNNCVYICVNVYVYTWTYKLPLYLLLLKASVI